MAELRSPADSCNILPGVTVDIWHSAPTGFYENQDPTQAPMNLRGVFRADADGRFAFRSTKPAGYPVPTDGPVGDLLRAQNRHPFRPAHLHILAYTPGYKTLTTQVFVDDDENLDSDVVFGVTQPLIGNYVRHESGSPPAQGAPRPGIPSTTPWSWNPACLNSPPRRSSERINRCS